MTERRYRGILQRIKGSVITQPAAKKNRQQNSQLDPKFSYRQIHGSSYKRAHN